MSLTADELIKKAIEQRARKRYEEALVSSLGATQADPNNANAWWQVALSRWEFGDARNAVPALRNALSLAPHFATGWARLGSALMKTGECEEAREAFEEAVDRDPEIIEALEALSGIYADEDNHEQDELELSILTRIENLAGLSSRQMNRFGILHYRRNHFFEAIKYWRQDAASSHPASLFNLGLAYSHSEVSQDADAVDMWRLALSRFPDYEPPTKQLANVLPRLLTLARNARAQEVTLLPSDQWYSLYLNPFELLNPPEDLDLEGCDPKTLQRLRKSLLQEIELEGKLEWMPGLSIDKSRAISVCEELNNEDQRAFHSYVFEKKNLLAFLSKGCYAHFLVDEHDSPLDTIELLDEDSEFLDWLSDFFSKQFDLVLTKAIDSKNLIVLECLLDGRRWVSPSHADKCFDNARRLVDRLLEPLREANNRADDEKPTVAFVQRLLERNALPGVLNLLPTYFQYYQNEAVSQIRGIAISCFNSHQDADLSREILQLTKLFRFKSAQLNQQLAEDFKKIEELIREERKHEAKLASGSDKWEITKEGARQGSRFIAAADAASVRWGAVITRISTGVTHEFLLAVTAEDGGVVQFSWKASQEIERHEKHYGDLINASLCYLLPAIVGRIEKRLNGGLSVRIGPCSLSRAGVTYETKGWLSTTQHSVPWPRVHISVENGEMIVSDLQSPKAKIAFPFLATNNAPVLMFMANANRNED